MLHCISRESAAGVNRLSYFLAVNFAQLPILAIMPLVYLSLLYTLTSPRCKIPLNSLYYVHYVYHIFSCFSYQLHGVAISGNYIIDTKATWNDNQTWRAEKSTRPRLHGFTSSIYFHLPHGNYGYTIALHVLYNVLGYYRALTFQLRHRSHDSLACTHPKNDLFEDTYLV